MPLRESNALLSSKYLPYVWGIAFLYPAVHFLIIQFTTHSYPNSFVPVVLGLLRISCCLLWFVALSSISARFRWLLLAFAAILGNASTQIYAWRGVFAGKHDDLSGYASLLTSLACIPILLAITSNLNKKDQLVVRLIDLALSLTLGYLFLVLILSPASPDGASSQANILSINRLIDFESIFLLVCASLQFLAADGAEDRRFFYIFFCYMAVSTPLFAIRNRWAARYPFTIWDLALDIPGLVFLLLALNPVPRWVYNFRAPSAIVHWVRGGSPLLTSLALTLLAIDVSRSHFLRGSVGILLGIAAYGMRNAIIHGKLLETEDSLVIAKQELEEQASRDGLTGIPNRRVFDQTLKREWRAAIQTGNALAVLMIDLDFFKALNDAYGHQRGDECLVAVAKAIQDELPRSGDFVGRYGGEEFVVILPATSTSGAKAVAERLRSSVIHLAIPHLLSQHDYLTVSTGVAVGDAACVPELEFLLKAADEALYRAKKAGRNRVEAVDLTVIRSDK